MSLSFSVPAALRLRTRHAVIKHPTSLCRNPKVFLPSPLLCFPKCLLQWTVAFAGNWKLWKEAICSPSLKVSSRLSLSKCNLLHILLFNIELAISPQDSNGVLEPPSVVWIALRNEELEMYCFHNKRVGVHMGGQESTLHCAGCPLSDLFEKCQFHSKYWHVYFPVFELNY